LREPNLGKTNPRVSLHYSLVICFVPSLVDLIIFLMLTRLVVVIIFENFSFALFTPPLGDYQGAPQAGYCGIPNEYSGMPHIWFGTYGGGKYVYGYDIGG
jgi:hypothetical protein